MSDFSFNGCLFPQTAEDLQKRLKDRYDPAKPYPALEGFFSIPADMRQVIADYIISGKPMGEDMVVKVAMAGWKKTGKESGKPYLSLQIKPHYGYEREEGTGEPVQSAVDQAASSLASATGGSVLDLF